MSIMSWMQQAKEVTKKFSEMMYIPAEDSDEPEITVVDSEAGGTVGDAVEDKDADTTENKENVSASDSTSEPQKDGNEQRIGMGLDRSALEADAAAAIEAAKKYASSFFSLAKEATVKAATTAEETAKKLQNVVAEKTIIGSLDREQAKFNEEVAANKLTLGALPWSDLPDQSIAKKHILALSLDSRNFTRDPPSKTNFDFAHIQSVAAALIEEDPNLRKIRFQLVPKQLSEERFWRNYFYRVSLVRQSALGEQSLSVAENPICSKNVSEMRTGKPDGNGHQKDETDAAVINNKAQREVDADDGEANDEKLKQIRKAVANAAQTKTSEDWEKDLLNDFNDYELVTGQMDKTDEQWEEEIAELLDSA